MKALSGSIILSRNLVGQSFINFERFDPLDLPRNKDPLDNKYLISSF